jgi:hypothetical protein
MGVCALAVSVCGSNATVSGVGRDAVNVSAAPVVSGVFPHNAASTGSSMLHAAGMYGTAAASLRMLLSATSCATTDWMSHSSLYCKTAWGLGERLTMVASVAQVKSQASLSQVSFSAPHVSSRFSFINASLLNATTCFFANATLCSLSPIAGFVSNASGFGAYPNLMDITLECRQ